MGTWLQNKVDGFLAEYKDYSIGIYGTGLNAERILENVSGYDFAYVISEDTGLLGEEFCGVSVVRLEDALPFVKVIILAAIPASAMAVYRRIKNCVPERITIFDMTGVELNRSHDIMAKLRHTAQNNTDRKMLEVIQNTIQDKAIRENEQPSVEINSVSKLTLYCIIPMLMAYLPWIIDRLKEKPNDAVLFVSRDGYLLEQIYQKVRREHPELNLPVSIYFYTSREAVTHAVSATEQDITVLCSTLDEYRKVSAKDHLEKVFGVSFSGELDNSIGEWVKEGKLDLLKRKILSYNEDIFCHAKKCRKGYQKYIASLELEKYENLWMVDLVTHGTSVYGLARMQQTPVHLLALATTKLPNAYIESSKCVQSLYGDGIVMGIGSFLSTMFSVLEMAFSSLERQLSGFDEEGNKEFAEQTEYDRDLLTAIHNKIEQFIANNVDKNWYLNGCSPAFAEAMLGLLHPCYSKIEDQIYEKFTFQDRLREGCARVNILRNIRGEV